MRDTNELLKEALKLAPKEKASFIEALIKSLDSPDPTLDKLWKQECESRLEAYENGNLKTVSVQEAFARYNLSSD